MTSTLRIDFVSDVACPWCAIGLASLEKALGELGGEVRAELHFQPFELNPGMPPEGQDIGEHLTQKYGSTPEQQAAAREAIRQRGEALGFAFRKEGRGRAHNTFDAHRLLHWAGLQGAEKQLALKKALLKAYHGEGRAPNDRAVLLDAVAEAGLDRTEAGRVFDEQLYADDVREREQFYQQHGISAVPSVIVNERHLIQGGQPPEVFAQALRQIAAEHAE
ncbi:MAG: DsbA family oxidoreductase [Pseudomonadota bacterium]